MRVLFLSLMLVLQATGAWSHLPAGTRSRMSAHAVNPNLVSAQAPAPPELPISGPWPVQLAANPVHINATSAMAVDVASGTVLYDQDAHQQLPIASITKLVTALVVLSRHNLTDIMTIPTLPQYKPEDERIGLVPGETYQLQDLLQALLIQSANDAADALAIADAGSTSQFAARMNSKLADWQISGARFVSPSGLIDTGNYATADALTKIARLVLTNAFLRQTVSEAAATITSGTGRTINLQSTNQLLAGGDFYGIKTGYTLAAGECFVGLTRINGHEVITVVLDASDRFGDSQTLANWISRSWQWL
ncbi:MAG TPA: serine hydrolase [Candidatus Saccharimonadia bacterium]